MHVELVPNLIASAMAPVFLLAGIGGFLNVIATRLARAVDRWRALSMIKDDDDLLAERDGLRRRIVVANLATSLCVGSGLSVCVVIILIYLNPLTESDFGQAAGWAFVIALVLLAGGLIAFLAEIRLALKTPLGRLPPVHK